MCATSCRVVHPWLEREAAGVGDVCAEGQPKARPAVDNKLLGERLEVCCTYDLVQGGTEDRWSAGEVILVSDGSNIWDPEKARTRYKKGEGVVMRMAQKAG